MAIILIVLLLAVLFGAAGFVIHTLWFLAAVFLIAWVAGFAFKGGEARWYRW